MNDVNIIKVQTKKEIKIFINLAYAIYKDNPYWVAPIEMDLKKRFNKNKNPFFNFGDMQLFIAFKNNKPVGRIAAIENRLHNKIHNENVGFFGFFECINDQTIANKLFDAAFEWLKNKGFDSVLGPTNPTSNDEYGLLIDGFEDTPRIMMPYNPPYYLDLINGYGFEKAKDLNAFKIENRKLLAQKKLVRGAEIVRKRNGVNIRHLDIKNFKAELDEVKKVYNKAWSPNWGFVPLTDEEIEEIAKDLKMLLDPNLVLFMEKNKETIGFALVIPDYNKIFVDIKGKFFPFGIFKFFARRNKLEWARVLILGILPEYQKKGLDALFYYEITKRAEKRGILYGEASWILEDNLMMNKGIEMMDGNLYKKYRVFKKKL